MANPEHLAKLREGIEAWNHWRLSAPVNHCDLSGASLQRKSFIGANLSEIDLSGAKLRKARFHWTDLSRAILADARLPQAELDYANLDGANLARANMQNASLAGANFRMTNLKQADLTGAVIGFTVFANVDLSEVKGLETVLHFAPSTVGLDTIYKSGDAIPHSFLRGCGVQEPIIRYLPSFLGTGIDLYSLFISFSTKDQEFADRLHADLQGNGVRCWFAPHDVKGGRKLHEQIDEAIRAYDKLLLILSPQSMKSEWVKTEIARARRRESQEGKQVLFPIALCPFSEIRNWECFDADTGKDSAREIREYFIPDFRNWKDHDSYRKAFDRLLNDLQGNAGSTA